MAYFERANILLEKIGNEFARLFTGAYVDNSLGDVMFSISQSSEDPDVQKSLIDQALSQFQKANKAFTEVEDQRGMAFSLNNLGKTYNALGEYQKARESLAEALKISFMCESPNSCIHFKTYIL